MAKGTLIAAMNIGRAADDEFHDWYDTEHLPERERVPGFLLCRRWLGADDPRISVATYDLASVGVLKSPAYLAIAGDNLSPWSKRVTARVVSRTRWLPSRAALGLAVLTLLMVIPAAHAADLDRAAVDLKTPAEKR